MKAILLVALWCSTALGQSEQTFTDSTGTYLFTNLDPGGNYTVTPRKFNVSHDKTAITAADATLAQQAAIGLVALTPEQRLAADANGDGRLTAIDASLILRYRLGLDPQLPVQALCGTDWMFVPSPTAAGIKTQPSIQDGICTLGAIHYNNLDSSRGMEDFHAIMFGDVNQSWSP